MRRQFSTGLTSFDSVGCIFFHIISTMTPANIATPTEGKYIRRLPRIVPITKTRLETGKNPNQQKSPLNQTAFIILSCCFPLQIRIDNQISSSQDSAINTKLKITVGANHEYCKGI